MRRILTEKHKMVCHFKIYVYFCPYVVLVHCTIFISPKKILFFQLKVFVLVLFWQNWIIYILHSVQYHEFFSGKCDFLFLIPLFELPLTRANRQPCCWIWWRFSGQKLKLLIFETLSGCNPDRENVQNWRKD